MIPYITRRIAAMGVLTVCASMLVFLIMRLVPGDPVVMMLGANAASSATIARVRTELGLNLPMYVQYVRWIGGILHGSFGTSYINNLPVTALIAENYPYTLQLTAGAVVVTVLFGLPLGTWAALRQHTVWDSVIVVLSLIGLAMPSFWLGLLLIQLFGVTLHWLPVFGGTSLRALILPALALGIGGGGVVARYVRSNVLETLRLQHVAVARSKGLSERRVLLRHVLRNGLLPVVTVLGLQVGNLLSGTIIVESVFSRPGLGRLLVTSILDKDYPSVQAVILLLTVAYVLLNLIIDLCYPWMDPRIIYS